MTKTPPRGKDALDLAIEHAVGHLVVDAQRTDAEGWTYASRIVSVAGVEDGALRVAVSSWLGRHDHQFNGFEGDPEGVRLLISTMLDESAVPRIAILRASRLPGGSADDLEVSVEYSELTFPEPVDISDLDLGGFSLFGEI